MDNQKITEINRIYSDMSRLLNASRKYPNRACELRNTGEEFYLKRAIIPVVIGKSSLFKPVENHANDEDLESLKSLTFYIFNHAEEPEDAFWNHYVALADSSIKAGTCKDSVLDIIDYAREFRRTRR